MINLEKNNEKLQHNIKVAREHKIVLPTFAQMKNPDLVPEKIKEGLKKVGLWDVDPLNLFRITWHNEPTMQGGTYGGVNFIEIPSSLSGVKARIIIMIGKWFPTGCHKVGASFGCLAPRLVTGQFDATYHHAVWPSTGNYCRGGAFNSKLLACESVAILPQDMSKERFDWLKSIAGQIIATPGCESNVKEIFDKTWELKQDPTMMIFNQFAEMGNPLWHYNVTGYALAELFEAVKKPGQSFAGACFTSGSAGTMSAGDLLKERYPQLKLAVGEALQCPTILDNGFGGHRIEGIGDKHIPWIHNVKNTDMAIAIDDEDSQRLLRLFNTPEGQQYMKDELGMSDEDIQLVRQIVRVVQKQLRPHILVQPCHAGHIRETPRRKPAVLIRQRALHIRARHDMRQLRRIRNHLVMRLRRRELHTQEAQFHEKVAGALQNRRVVVAVTAQNHRRMVEQIIAGVLEAAVLAPRHRVSADEFKAVGFCKLVSGCKDISLYTGAVYDDRAFFDYVRLALKKFDR